MTSTDTTLELVDCVARTRQRDQAASRSLVEYLYPMVSQLVRCHLPPGSDEEEKLMREIFMEIFAKLDRFAGEIPLELWVARIAVKHCLRAMRAQKSRLKWRKTDLSQRESAALDALKAALLHDPDPAHLPGARELVEKLLETLAPKDRLLIRLMEMEELSVAKIQAITGWSSAAICARARRAREKLNWLYWELVMKK